MKAMVKILGAGVAAVALFSAAPASAQYYPGYGYGYPNSGGVIGQVINQVLGGGYGNGYGYQANSQMAVQQCTAAVQARLNGNRYGSSYGYNSPYGYNGYNNARVLGISRVEQRSNGGLTIRGVANSGATAAYGYGYAAQAPVDLTFKCKTDYRGFVTDVDVDRVAGGYNGAGYGYSPYANDYSQYGYRRY